jgi:hypothetical protein
MNKFKSSLKLLAGASVALACLAGCGGGGGSSSTVPPIPPPSQTQFSVFAEQTFANNANSTPVSLDGFTFDFDADENPTAFDSLVMSGTYY